MAVTQYIGARYVPKFYENSDGTEEWRAGVEYEPLTIVTYNGNSYTSKKPVPSNIGNPSANPSYWAATGNYNQQVEEYRQQVEEYRAEVQEVTADLDRLQNKKFIFIGDSYAWGFNNAGRITSFIDYTVSALGLTEGVNYYRSDVNGAGFAHSIGENQRFINLIQGLASTVTDPESITDIITLGSINDIDQGAASINSAIQAYVNYCKATYPNARVHIGAIGGYAFSPVLQDKAASVRNVYRECAQYGAIYMTGVEWVVHNHKTEWNQAEDNLHWNTAGQMHMSKAFMQYLLGGTISTNVNNMPVTFNMADSIKSPETVTFYGRQANDVCWLECDNPLWDITFSDTVTIAPNTSIDFGVMDLGLVNAAVYDIVRDGVPCLTGDGASGFIRYTYRVSDNHLIALFRITGSHQVTRLYTLKPRFICAADYC